MKDDTNIILILFKLLGGVIGTLASFFAITTFFSKSALDIWVAVQSASVIVILATLGLNVYLFYERKKSNIRTPKAGIFVAGLVIALSIFLFVTGRQVIKNQTPIIKTINYLGEGHRIKILGKNFGEDFDAIRIQADKKNLVPINCCLFG